MGKLRLDHGIQLNRVKGLDSTALPPSGRDLLERNIFATETC